MNTLFREERLHRIVSDLAGMIFVRQMPCALMRLEGRYDRPEQAQKDAERAVPFGFHDTWGGRNTYSWFWTEIPAAVCGVNEERVLIAATADDEGVETARMKSFVSGETPQWDLMNPQMMLFINGQLVQGLDVHHRVALLPDEAIRIDLQAYAGLTDRYCLLRLWSAVRRTDVHGLYYDLRTALEIAQCMDEYDPHRETLLAHLNNAVNLLDLRDPHSARFIRNVAQARAYLAENVYIGSNHPVQVVVSGHTHIDVAWLWDHDQTRLKALRSFSGMMRLFERYPEFTFFQSTPQLLKWLADDHPELSRQVRRRIDEGRFEVDGALWLEADCNIPSGESLMRQLLHGKRWISQNCGTDCEVLWLPDVFGYSASLPQMLKLAGIPTFVTTKISWNKINKMPYDVFEWAGIDGSSVLTYFITTTEKKREDGSFGTTYNGILTPSSVAGGWDRFQQKGLSQEILEVYGYGDGGGGPDEAMLEAGVRMQRGVPGFPRVTMGHVRPFFKRLHSKLQDQKYLPKWVGELYLELHQGAYTSCAWIKQNNRMAESKLAAAEFVQTAAMTVGGVYRQQALQEAWETLLLHQFHDTLPGSCIGKVYQDARPAFEQLHRLADGAIADAASFLWGDGEQLLVWNDCAFERQGTVLLPSGRMIAGQPYQTTETGNLCMTPSIPSMGWRTVEVAEANDLSAVRAAGAVLETPRLRIEINENGEIAALFDKKRRRSVLREGAMGNELRLYEDRPASWDTWNIDMYYEEHAYPVNECVSMSALSGGPLFSSVVVEKHFGRSVIRQEIRAWNEDARVEFITDVDWHEDACVLKAVFPLAIHADEAAFDIQCGSIRRPVHRNTSWDMAKYEVCAQRWADLSEGDYGVSLINDCKYGYSVEGGVLSLTLLKAGMAPDQQVDRGKHHFAYALYLHDGPCGVDTERQAAAFNRPLHVHAAAKPAAPFSLLRMDNPCIALDSLKKSEDGSDVVIHLHEMGNTRAETRLDLGFAAEAVWQCDLLENAQEELAVCRNQINLIFRPFEIKILRFRLSKQ